METKYDWMETYTGRKFFPTHPSAGDICIEDIVHALSMLCRFGGHCREFYSVAQHSCLVADMVENVQPDAALAALMHDAEEAYIGDIIRPIKRSVPEISNAGAEIELMIFQVFGIPHPMPEVVKWADNVMLKNEHAQIMHGRNEWPSCDKADGPKVLIMTWSPQRAKEEFMKRFRRLYK